jgi:putative (di)nucleoside polyphosphate hydrolase
MTIDPATLPYRPCVGITLINGKGEIFAGQRLDATVAAWQMPQGGIDAGENARDAAYRELWEETGVTADKVAFLSESADWVTYDLPPELLGKVWGGAYRGQKQKWFLFRFTGNDADIRIDSEHPEFARWRWIGAAEMVASIVPFKRAVYEAVVTEFRPHLAP